MLKLAANNPGAVSVIAAMVAVVTDVVMVAVAMAGTIKKDVKRARQVTVSRRCPSVMTFRRKVEAAVVVASKKRAVSQRKFVNRGHRVSLASRGRREMTSQRRKAPSRQHRLLGLRRRLMAMRVIVAVVGVVVAVAVASGVTRCRSILMDRCRLRKATMS